MLLSNNVYQRSFRAIFYDYLIFHFIAYYFATHIFLTLTEDNKRHLGKKTSASLREFF